MTQRPRRIHPEDAKISAPTAAGESSTRGLAAATVQVRGIHTVSLVTLPSFGISSPTFAMQSGSALTATSSVT